MTDKENGISFHPLNEGLGFHPFADGLPYTPSTKVTKPPRPSATPFTPPVNLNSGTGAVAAGSPIPVTRPIFLNPQIAAQNPTSSTMAPVAIPEQAYGFPYLIKRGFAFLLDTSLNTGLCTLGLSAALWNHGLKAELFFNPGVAILATLFLVVFNWALITAQEVAFSTTIGKRLFGLALEGSPSALFLRALFFLPSFGFGGIGLLWSLFDSKKRCWHDLAVGIQPIEISRL